MKRVLIAVVGLVTAVAIASPASASTQVIDASLGTTLAMTTEPDATVTGWSLSSTGANTVSGGSLDVNANVPYTVTVTADKSRMTEYVAADGDYKASSPKTLTTAMTVTATHTGGTAPTAGVGAAAVIGSSTTLATGTGLGTDNYTLSISQPTLITDAALASGNTYHIVLTYTVSSTL